MKTKDRIIKSSIELFNKHGVSNVTTNHIAEYMGISPGNLYYHFRNKEEIVYEVFGTVDSILRKSWSVFSDQQMSLTEIADYIQVMFTALWDYYFFFRDLPQLLKKDEKLKEAYRQLHFRYVEELDAFYVRLSEIGFMKPMNDPSERRALVINTWMIAGSWAGYLEGLGEPISPGNLRQGLEQISHLIRSYTQDHIRDSVTMIMTQFAAKLEKAALEKESEN
ncbi:MAG: TetR/AcrR family transcriptional regulator [SAR324 cluster bacterium]|nr:TetR/AcrR family transcriptional regulator [SAR324 cluster bacterium]